MSTNHHLYPISKHTHTHPCTNVKTDRKNAICALKENAKGDVVLARGFVLPTNPFDDINQLLELQEDSSHETRGDEEQKQLVRLIHAGRDFILQYLATVPKQWRCHMS